MKREFKWGESREERKKLKDFGFVARTFARVESENGRPALEAPSDRASAAGRPAPPQAPRPSPATKDRFADILGQVTCWIIGH